MTNTNKPRILTGDTPTGKLHLGHYVGSIENRLAMQEQFDCYFLIANKHAFTTRADKPDEIRDKGLGDEYPFGFPLYAVGQCADILAFRPQYVPVGEDQLPHLELSREVARRFDQMYC